ncbi:two-component hybrid sensor and regulator [Cylindrospermum sp. NIES-4074]|nr:two-component hybrid sensor and regulator [Cylindrospermum sp. NIES-4074]
MAQPLTVLIIDDSPEDRQVYRRYLLQDREHSYTILEEESGEEALEACQQFQPDGILLDFLLPDLDGLEFLAALKQQSQGVMPAVIMLTGYGNETVAVQAMKNGVQDYLVKGETTGELLRSTIHSAIKNAQLAQKLQESEDRFRASVENMLDCFSIYSAIRNNRGEILDFRIDYVNAAACECHQMTKQEQLGKGLCEILPTHRESGLFDEYCQVVDTGEPLVKESQNYIYFDGKQQLSKVFDFRITKMGDGLVASWRDVTEKKQAEEQLRLSNERFQLAAAAVNCLIYDWDLRKNSIARTEGLTRILGYSLEEAAPTFEWWNQLIHPDDWEHLEQDFQATLAHKNYYAVEYRVRHKDNQYRYVLDQGVIARDTHGQAVRAVGSTTDISEQQAALHERKYTEAALRQSEAKFRRIVESNIVGMYFGDFSGCIYEANDAFLDLFGYTREELVAGNIRWDWMTPPEYQDFDQQKIQELQTSGVCTPFEKEYFRKDGTRIPILLGIARIDGTEENGYSACFVLDLTQRKRAEAALRQSEERYRYLSDAIPQLVWICDANGEYEHVNQRWCEFTGQTVELSMRFDWTKVIHPDEIQLAMGAWMEALRTGEPYEQEMRYKSRDGTYRWHLARAVPIKDEQGRVIKWFGTSTDINDRKQLEVERTRLLQLEQIARAEAEAANQAKDEFVAMVSHDLRSPLNAILGWAKLLRTRQVDTATVTNALETIERNAKSQAKLLEDLQNISRILQGKLHLEVSKINLVAVVGAALDTAYPSANAKTIALESVIEKSIPTVLGDANRLLQVLGNLLSNAIKFTPPEGRVQVHLSVVSCQKTQQTTGSYAQIIVSDTGIGISPEFLPYVFERYHQGDRTHKQGGLGLGLAIARHLVELHGGTIEAASAGQDKGATFTIKLPL